MLRLFKPKSDRYISYTYIIPTPRDLIGILGILLYLVGLYLLTL